MTVKDRFSLLLNLKLPTLLGIFDLIQHIGSTAGAGQHIMGICERLVIPNIIIALYQLRVSKQASLQYGLNQSKIYHVQK